MSTLHHLVIWRYKDRVLFIALELQTNMSCFHSIIQWFIKILFNSPSAAELHEQLHS